VIGNRSLTRAFNIDDLRRLARTRLPLSIFDFLDGGAEDEVSLTLNTAAFDEYHLVPNVLRDVSRIDLSTTLLGQRIEWPVILSPTGSTRLFHCDGELAVARAAKRAGTMYSLSTMSTTNLEDVAKESSAPKIFQLYVFRDRGVTRHLVDRCRAAGYAALCLTVDTPLGGNRERDRVSGMTMPPRFTPRTFAGFVSHPGWTWDAWRRLKFSVANFEGSVSVPPLGLSAVQYVNGLFDRSVQWADAAWLAGIWGGPFVIKGISSIQDAISAVGAGATAIMVSNHGGRQLDGAAPPIDRIAAIRDAVGDSLQIILDGGVRRGTHVLKAIARGADACAIGRPYLYGLAAAGEQGVDHALTILRSELERDAALLGCARILDITASNIVRRNAWPAVS
jgi:L-lactate dehydrogenase (cytochrome)